MGVIKIMKKIIFFIIINSLLFSCEIHTSPPDYNIMKLAPQDGWFYNVIPIEEKGKIKKFEEAFKDNDYAIKEYIKDTLCKKLKWDGVVNYNLKWQITPTNYVFIVTFDAFKYQK